MAAQQVYESKNHLHRIFSACEVNSDMYDAIYVRVRSIGSNRVSSTLRSCPDHSGMLVQVPSLI